MLIQSWVMTEQYFKKEGSAQRCFLIKCSKYIMDHITGVAI